jgi:copper homeostasis protein
MTREFLVEVCVDSIESAVAAERGGAHRIELCSSLGDGGITPSSGTIAAVREKVGITLHVMIRPRAADFCYSSEEFRIMQYDILAAKRLGADGVVFGILDLNGNVDTERTRQLAALAAPLRVTFHRAFDMSSDLLRSFHDLQGAGVHCVLTSGGKQTAAEGAETLKSLVDAATNGVAIMAGGGIDDQNVAALISRTGVRQIHASLKSSITSPMRFQNQEISMGTAGGHEYEHFIVSEQKVQRLLQAASDGE